MAHGKHIGIAAVSAEGTALCYRTISEADSPLPVLDSTRILARAALREATGYASVWHAPAGDGGAEGLRGLRVIRCAARS